MSKYSRPAARTGRGGRPTIARAPGNRPPVPHVVRLSLRRTVATAVLRPRCSSSVVKAADPLASSNPAMDTNLTRGNWLPRPGYGDQMSDAGAPLAGVTVVALEQAVSAPMCTRTLADFGARVIKVENPVTAVTSPATTTMSSMVPEARRPTFVWVNRNKESVALDLQVELKDWTVSSTGCLGPGRRLGVPIWHLERPRGSASAFRRHRAPRRHPDVIAVEIDGVRRGRAAVG